MSYWLFDKNFVCEFYDFDSCYFSNVFVLSDEWDALNESIVLE
jgi:hypothetical protein